MDNILQFPTKEDQSEAKWDGTVAGMIAGGFSPDCARAVVGALKRRQAAMPNPVLTFGPVNSQSPEEISRAIVKLMRESQNWLWWEIAQLEAELYLLRPDTKG